MKREEVVELLEQADKLHNGEESTLTMEDIDLLERHDITVLEMNTSFLDVGCQPYINIKARAEELRKLLFLQFQEASTIKIIQLDEHPILMQAYEVCIAIEECGASVELTNAVTKANALLQDLKPLMREFNELKENANV